MAGQHAETFADRRAAGRALAEHVEGYLGRLERIDRPPLVLALPRGGVPIGLEVAGTIGAELDIVVARKVGMPGHPEFGIGAVTESGPPIFNQDVLHRAGLSEQDLEPAVAAERAEAARRLKRYRGDRPAPQVTGRVVFVVDDGLATGVTALAALRALRAAEPARLAFAAPVCAPEAAGMLSKEIDAVICVRCPSRFGAVSQFYEEFEQLTDDEVVELMGRPATNLHATPPGRG